MKNRALSQQKIIAIVSWALVFAWMVVIFCFSAQPAHESDELSKGITSYIAQAVIKIAPEAEVDIEELNHVVRKTAHFVVYFILGILTINALRVSGLSGFKAISLVFAICVAYAVTDEIHQLFVPGRGAQLKDVLIDSAGAILGIVVYVFAGDFVEL